MSRGLGSEWTAALAQVGITTAYLAWFDFDSGPVAVWTGSNPIVPTGTGDTLLDGVQFSPIAEGPVVDISENAFSYSGSEAFTLSLGIPASPSTSMANASVDADEYLTRTAVVWRAVIVTPATSTAAPQWAFRRIRAGAMDELAISHDGKQHTFTMTIEAHASMISKASGSTYLDQKKFDPTDTSQDFTVSLANSRDAPSTGTAGIAGGGNPGSGQGSHLTAHV